MQLIYVENGNWCLEKRKKKRIKFHIFRFYPTFDMSYLNVYPYQKCKKHLLKFVLD